MKRIFLSFVFFIIVILPINVAQSEQFNLSLETVPKGFKGDDIIKVIKALNKNIASKINGNYKLIYGPFDNNDTDRIYTFKLADDCLIISPTELRLDPFISSSWGLVGPERCHYLVRNLGEKQKNYIGQNAFGAKVRVEDYIDSKYFITIVNASKVPYKFNISSFNPNKIGVLVICKPERLDNDKGYVDYPGRSYAATFDSPMAHHKKYYSLGVIVNEIWLYDKASGRIYLKYKTASST